MKDIHGNLILGGHSKGGNLAVYAASFCNSEVQDRISKIYTNDGPGFANEIIETENYSKIANRIISYVPQFSVVGRLLVHEEEYYVVKSVETGIMQHDPYTWQVNQNRFEKLKDVTNGSLFTEKTIKEWLTKVDKEKREVFIDTLYEILTATQANKVTDLSKNWIKTSSTLLKKYKGIDEESKKVIEQTLEALRLSAKNQFLSSFSIKKKDEKKKYFGILSK